MTTGRVHRLPSGPHLLRRRTMITSAVFPLSAQESSPWRNILGISNCHRSLPYPKIILRNCSPLLNQLFQPNKNFQLGILVFWKILKQKGVECQEEVGNWRQSPDLRTSPLLVTANQDWWWAPQRHHPRRFLHTPPSRTANRDSGRTRHRLHWWWKLLPAWKVHMCRARISS